MCHSECTSQCFRLLLFLTCKRLCLLCSFSYQFTSNIIIMGIFIITNSIYIFLQLKKSRSDAEDRRRKSLLPWSRKSRCKSRDRSVASSHDDSESVCSSRSSLASWDLALSTALCRVVLPDGATAVVQIRPPQTIRQLILRLLDKRALRYTHFQVFLSHSNKVIIICFSLSF